MYKKIYFVLFIILSFSILPVQAKELHLYFNLNGGTVAGDQYYVTDDGYLVYNSTYYALYMNKKIKNINSINGVPFHVTKDGASLVPGKEWYFKNFYDNTIYYLSESKTYDIDQFFKILENEDTFASIDLYANWDNKKVKSGKDIGSSKKKKATSIEIQSNKKTVTVGNTLKLEVKYKPSNAETEFVNWSSSNEKIATVNSAGVVKGIKKGKVTIYATSTNRLKDKITIQVNEAKSNYVNISFNANGGTLNKAHGDAVTIQGNSIICNGNSVCERVASNGSLPDYGLRNMNNSKYINLTKQGYYIEPSAAWNTSADGTGTSYSQFLAYNSNDFCNASDGDCSVTLYANWKKSDKLYTIALIGNSKTAYYGGSPRSSVGSAFKSMVTSTKKSAHITLITKGGSSLEYKATHADYMEKIKGNSYDYVVLQERTDVAYGKYATYKSGAQKTIQLLKNKNATFFVRTTWPDRNSSFDKNVDKMSTNAEKVASTIGGSVIYDNKAFKAALNGKIQVYLDDNKHPTPEGAYMVAACIYKKIFQTDVSTMKYYYSINQDTAKKLLQYAQKYC